ncbi:TetR/AcrR family transcriptional regulator [Marinivivus vitaminiproducens]|uniref:TetR/AcrR family transcriptional regulator n=1 Tax=Marinivivus vitaminiproducens TaxID=3035935 RepID=UPI00279C1C4A|nr:TetR/AcrR family transcriptional regulator [Geminicoccaceae bacterium SCSIO 64248]
MSSRRSEPRTPPRQRMARDDRHRQLLDVAWRLVREEGTNALTLGRLAEWSGVTKPVVYSHFPTRTALLSALYREFDARENAIIDAALAASEPTLPATAAVIASSFVDCVLAQGREIPGLIAALAGSPELEAMKREGDAAFLEKCRLALEPFGAKGTVAPPGLRAMLGAAEALSAAAVNGEITAAEAQDELSGIVVAMVERSGRPDRS